MSGYKYYDESYSNGSENRTKSKSSGDSAKRDLDYEIKNFIVFKNNEHGEVEQYSQAMCEFEDASNFMNNHSSNIRSSLFIMATIKEKK